MNRLYTEIHINAPAEQVWRVLTDFGSYPEWNPFIRRIGGPLKRGEKLEVYMKPAGRFGRTSHPTVVKAESNHELCWLGIFVMKSLFAGEHCFAIESLGNGTARFIQSECFTGLLAPLFAVTLKQYTLRGFEEMNAALKLRAET